MTSTHLDEPPTPRGGDEPLWVSPTARRRPSMAVGGILLVVLFMLVFGTLYMRADQRVTVLTVTQRVPAGHAVTSDDLGTARVSVSGVATVAADQRSQIVGKIAAVDLLPGSLLNDAMLTDQAIPAPGQALVGVSLSPGHLPAGGVAPGDPVQVIRTVITADAPGYTATVLSARAVVFDAKVDEETGIHNVSLVVADADAPAVARAAAADEVSIVLLPRAA